MKNFFHKTFTKTKKFIKAHKIWSLVIIIALISIAGFVYKKATAPSTAPQYILATAGKGSIVQTITGSGQVSSENQLDIASEVSGKILAINKKVGDKVKTGDIIATLDSHDAYIDLQNARIAYAKLTEPAKVGDVVNAQNNVTKAYNDAFEAMANTFLHVPGIMTGLEDLFFGRSGYLGDSQSTSLTETGKSYRSVAANSYQNAKNNYTMILEEYKNIKKTSPASSIESVLEKTSDFAKQVSEALKNSQAAVTFISGSQTDYNASGASAAASSITTWSGQLNGDLSSLISVRNSLASNKDSLMKLEKGADTLDVQSQQLSLQQKERAYGKYFIRAPFEGIIGRIPVHVYDQANGGTVIATISSNQKITNIPLNEVDAVKVANGQKAVLTFDAVEGLKVDGTVTQVDLIGTASQGVVTYNVKISFEGSNVSIRPGMSVDAMVVTSERKDVLVVPASAVKVQGKRHYVEIFDEVLKQQNVTIGETDDTNTEILEGINEGQKVVARVMQGGTAAGTSKSPAPTILNGLGGSQRNVIRNAR